MSNVLTPHFRVSYPNVFKAKLNDLSGKEEYSLVAVYPKGSDLKVLQAAVQDAIIKKWGKVKEDWPQNLKLPFRKHEERAKVVDGKKSFPAGYEEGGIFITLKSSQRPQVIDGRKQPITDPVEFYAGCWARATVNAYAYEKKGNRGVAFGLNNIQKVKDGDPISGRTTAEHDFEALEEAGTEASSLDMFT